jgi:hypothetical protein
MPLGFSLGARASRPQDFSIIEAAAKKRSYSHPRTAKPGTSTLAIHFKCAHFGSRTVQRARRPRSQYAALRLKTKNQTALPVYAASLRTFMNNAGPDLFVSKEN